MHVLPCILLFFGHTYCLFSVYVYSLQPLTTFTELLQLWPLLYIKLFLLCQVSAAPSSASVCTLMGWMEGFVPPSCTPALGWGKGCPSFSSPSFHVENAFPQLVLC